VIATFADMQGYVAQRKAGVINNVTPTVHMSIDYLAPVLLGDWLEGDTTLLKATRNLLFCQTVAKVDEKPVFRSSGIFKVGPISTFVGATLNDFFELMEEK
jgi:acyl-coenzyme A thioesterase PaaI-like protein